MKTHQLKTLPHFFEQVEQLNKHFELRKDDRGFEEGDRLILSEYDPEEGFTGREVWVIVNYILRDFEGLREGYCIMDIRPDHQPDDLPF